MSRVKKILIVSFVLALGIVLAMPYRKGATTYTPEKSIDPPVVPSSDLLTSNESPTRRPLSSAKSTLVPSKHIPAKMASTTDIAASTPSHSGFDLENHATLVGQPSDTSSPTKPLPEQSPVTPNNKGEQKQTSRPAYSTTQPNTADRSSWPEEIEHIVRNGDTLEKLAERYLGDAGRALELFDLNRDQLANPHLLPIGAELRVPVPPRRESD